MPFTDLDFATASIVTTATPSGPLRGKTDGTLMAFLGIPYARPPVKEGRFRPPRPLTARASALDAFRLAPSAPQLPDPGFYPGDPQAMPVTPMDEDCLYLNVWAPAAPGPHPVLIWLHGGSQVVGGTARPVYDGAVFARAGIVCVTVGHRIGLLGLLECGGILGPDYADSANSVLRDALLALRWVRGHIGAFGGDPARVTLGGESAGGKNVAALMAASEARGLFQAAIVVSGGAESVSTRVEAERIAATVIERAGLSPDDLLTTDWVRLLDAQRLLLDNPPRNLPLRPMVGGTLLPEFPLATIAAGRGASVPLLIGTSRDECLPTLRTADLSEAWTSPHLCHISPERMTAVEARARAAWPELSPLELRLRLRTAEAYALPSQRLADANTGAGNPTWMYRNDQEQTDGPFKGYAPHVSDLDRIWSVPASLNALPPDSASRGLHRLFCDFVHRHEAPWPTFDRDRSTALIGEALTVVADPFARLRSFFSPDR